MVELLDTAGIHQASSNIEMQGIQRAREVAATADLILLMSDITQPANQADESMVLASQPVLRLLNKVDLIESDLVDCSLELGSERSVKSRASATDTGHPLRISSLTGAGIDTMMRHIIRQLIPETLPVGAAVPLTARQVDWLRRASDAANTQVSMNSLHRLLDGSE
ncbi:MAG: hypothetical protein R3C05_32115 [Pirellulaceae bacterium]